MAAADSLSTPTLQSLLEELRSQFAEAGISDPSVDAQLIAAHVLGETRGRIQALEIMGKVPTSEQTREIRALGARRAKRFPLQHLTGLAPFRQLELHVGPGVFVPRPETETVVQLAIDELQRVPDPIAIDLCTGSGAIALAMATEVPGARVWAVEKSDEAHAWATRNIDELGEGRVTLLQGDVAELDAAQGEPRVTALQPILDLRGRISVIASNPPYVPKAAIPRDPEVRDHDPALALYSGEDGLDLIRIISRAALELIAPGGLIVLEHAELQGADIRALLERDGWVDARTYEDLTWRDRATTARSAG